MAKSYVDQKLDLMHQLLWSNFLKEYVETTLWTIPWAGPLLKIPFVDAVLMAVLENYLEKPLLKIVTRFGIFTSIDWQSAETYDAYEKQAEKLLAAQAAGEWDPTDRKAFRDAARSLIRFNIRTA